MRQTELAGLDDGDLSAGTGAATARASADPFRADGSPIDWRALAADLDAQGSAVVPGLLSSDECVALAATYDDDARFRSHVRMQRHGFGRGEYKYFGYPLPSRIEALRRGFYRHLAPIANDWQRRLGQDAPFPPAHETFVQRCRAAGQCRPTPLLLRYTAQDFNRLHQDVYGDLLFPLQLIVLLDEPGRDFTGGELVLTEQKPRMQSRAEVVPLRQGDGVVIAVRERPETGARGDHRVLMRHGVSRVRSGRRHSLGIIFHDAP